MDRFDTRSAMADRLPKAGSRWCDYEKRAIEIRRLAGVGYRERFDPALIAGILNYRIIGLSSLAELPAEFRECLTTGGQWSGAALPIAADGSAIIIVNDSQSRRRQRATIMEEICHLILGHQPSLIRTDSASGARTHDRRIEEEAYGVGAATLAPYQALAEMIAAEWPVERIANWFDVSRPLVEYRLRVTGLQRSKR